MAKKLFYSMGEVSEMFDVNPSLIRHWESKFEVLKPQKNKKGNRMFTPEDVENLKLIYHLVKERGMTLDGARRALKGGGMPGVARDMELLEQNAIGVWSLNSAFHPSDRTQAANELASSFVHQYFADYLK